MRPQGGTKEANGLEGALRTLAFVSRFFTLLVRPVKCSDWRIYIYNMYCDWLDKNESESETKHSPNPLNPNNP